MTKWTTEQPTTPGWYWYRYTLIETPIHEVGEVMYAPLPVDGLVVRWNDGQVDHLERTIGEWQPVAEPEA